MSGDQQSAQTNNDVEQLRGRKRFRSRNNDEVLMLFCCCFDFCCVLIKKPCALPVVALIWRYRVHNGLINVTQRCALKPKTCGTFFRFNLYLHLCVCFQFEFETSNSQDVEVSEGSRKRRRKASVVARSLRV